MKYDPWRYMNSALGQKVLLFTRSESWICWWCIMLIKLFIPTTMVSYTCHPQPLHRGLIKTLNVGSFPLREVMRAEHATFCMYSGASIHTEVCPLRQLYGFDSMEWEGPSLPGVWYNESELTTHDLQLFQINYLKRLEPETVQQTALIHLYTCSLVLSLSVPTSLFLCELHEGGLMCFNVWLSVIPRWRERTLRHGGLALWAPIHNSNTGNLGSQFNYFL